MKKKKNIHSYSVLRFIFISLKLGNQCSFNSLRLSLGFFLYLYAFQAMFGRSSSLAGFKMFKSEGNQNLLFKDSTKCLQEVPTGKNYKEFLGNEYVTTIDSLRECAGSKTGGTANKFIFKSRFYRWNNKTNDHQYYDDPSSQCQRHSSFFFPLQNWRRPVPSIPAKGKSKCSSLSQIFSPACMVVHEGNCRQHSHLLAINSANRLCNLKKENSVFLVLYLFSQKPSIKVRHDW